MLLLLVCSWLTLPLAPLNPIAQDTVAPASIHVTAGLSGPTAVLSAGPEIAAKYELLVTHPLIVRAEGSYHLSAFNSPLYPRGDFKSASLALDVLCYRGTDILLAYLGAGVVYSFNSFNPTETSADSLSRNWGVTDLKVTDAFGYRLTFGLRLQRSYSIEMAITESRPQLQYIRSHGPASYSSRNQSQLRTGGFRLSVGYLFSLRRR